jgi:hypothetical protein
MLAIVPQETLVIRTELIGERFRMSRARQRHDRTALA